MNKEKAPSPAGPCFAAGRLVVSSGLALRGSCMIAGHSKKSFFAHAFFALRVFKVEIDFVIMWSLGCCGFVKCLCNRCL